MRFSAAKALKSCRIGCLFEALIVPETLLDYFEEAFELDCFAFEAASASDKQPTLFRLLYESSRVGRLNKRKLEQVLVGCTV
jgi:hypothetical protein